MSCQGSHYSTPALKSQTKACGPRTEGFYLHLSFSDNLEESYIIACVLALNVWRVLDGKGKTKFNVCSPTTKRGGGVVGKIL